MDEVNNSEVAELPAIYIWNGQAFQDTTEFVTLSGMPGHWNKFEFTCECFWLCEWNSGPFQQAPIL